MTKEEAIKELKGLKGEECDYYVNEALKMAIDSLKSDVDERAKVIAEIEKGMHEAYKGTSHTWESMVFDLVIEQIKEQSNSDNPNNSTK